MQLEPCTQCRRHIASDAPSCPFCGASRESTSRSLVAIGGRLSRAAVFSLAACSGSAPSAQEPPPPPPPPPPVVTIDAGSSEGSAVDAGTVRGKVLAAGQPAIGIRVFLDDGLRESTTDNKGEFEFRDVPAGNHHVSLQSNHPRQPPPSAYVTVTTGQVANVTLQVPQAAPAERSNIPMPYGAPPARSRIV